MHLSNLSNPITNLPSDFHHRTPLHSLSPNLSTLNLNTISKPLSQSNLSTVTRSKNSNKSSFPSAPDSVKNLNPQPEQTQAKSFYGAVSLITGTAVGPGMLGLPSATIKSGPLPSTLIIILSWVYVISSVLLVAELSFAAMEEDGVAEVSFTGLAMKALGPPMGSLVAVIYASLNFALLVACISGIASLVVKWFPAIHPIAAHALFPTIVGTLIRFFPFKTIDTANRILCFFMLFSITSLVAIGLSVGRRNLLGSFVHASWSPPVILPAIPVTVLTLGFHVITPFVCRIAGETIYDVRKAIVFGGAVPLVMVLSWNLVVLGLSGTGLATDDPIKLLLSVNSLALPAIQGFAFSALATSLIGYALSFPKQLADTLEFIMTTNNGKQANGSLACLPTPNQRLFDFHGTGRPGFVVFMRSGRGVTGKATFNGSLSLLGCDKSRGLAVEACVEDYAGNFVTKMEKGISSEAANQESSPVASNSGNMSMMLLVLGVSVLVGSFFRTAFSVALDFSGVYANYFLFGILPPVMAWIHRSRKNRSLNSREVNLLPGGDGTLLLLFGVSVILGIWH